MKPKKQVFIKVFLGFTLLGPPIGSFVAVLGLEVLSGDFFTSSLSDLLGEAILAILFSYFLGLPQAIGAGIYLAWKIANQRTVNIVHYYLAPMYVTLGLAVIYSILPDPTTKDKVSMVAQGLIYSAICSSFSCFVLLKIFRNEFANTPYHLKFTNTIKSTPFPTIQG